MPNPPTTSSPKTRQWTCPPPPSSISPNKHSTPPSNPPKPQPQPDLPIPPFRNVSACNRCRIRKHRCDQRLPRCETCEKAQVRCVGYDPLTKQEVPRSYVAFLESRVNYLNQVLLDHEISFKPALPYDEEETLKIEAGQRSERGLRDWRELSETPGLRKRKSADDAIPARQMKRLAQLNVLLTDLITDACGHRGREGEREERRRDGSLEQRLPWSPRSLDSVDHSDSRTSPESESPGSSRESYRYLKTASGGGASLSGARSGSGLDRGLDGQGTRTRPGIDPGLVDFKIPDTKPLIGEGRSGNTVPRPLDLPSHVPQQKVEDPPVPEPKFDIAADLLRGRMERERERERNNFDLLDEFLVDWTD
ncbi:hypothetical protein N7457_006153 [Penicillium paradoxum]|uniref:uncharacterized protein n=1 Tax=Penicillium paradoxum TaxID=176176 RepID=UPI0025471A82|nr:uncharacterized protein N7457_006153 [Penicillium paradoxum]KAJ5780993.1 hypothetical protein N7457_006153 [Penicillium paradoxum]